MERQAHRLMSGGLGTVHSVSSFHFGVPGRGKAYIQAALHADEVAGTLVLKYLKYELCRLEAEGRLGGEIILVPQANPIGHVHALRSGASGGHYVNRHYPDFCDGVFVRVESQLGLDAGHNTELIRNAIRQEIAGLEERNELTSLRKTLMSLAADADIVLDLHGEHRAALHLYTATPLWSQCEPLARLLGSRAQLLTETSAERPFDEACSQPWWQLRQRCAAAGIAADIDLACLAVTVELRGQQEVSHELARRDAAALVDFLTLRGLIVAGAEPVLPPLRYPATPLDRVETLDAPIAGVVCFHVAPGDVVVAGQPVADVIDPLEDRLVTLSSFCGGMVYAIAAHPYAAVGETVAQVATTGIFGPV